jgi:glycosyltransferase involved in cell wall biosynthesis
MSTSSKPTSDVRCPLKLKIVCSRLWPGSSTTDFAVRDLAEAIANTGVNVEVVSACCDKASPANFDFRNFQVQRIYRSMNSPWSGYRYQKRLRRFLVNSNADGVIFFDAFQDFQQLAKTFSGQIPTIVRIHDHQYQLLQNLGPGKQRQCRSLKLADRVIVESVATKTELSQLGLEPDKIIVADDFVRIEESLDSHYASQSTARQTIGAAHPMLSLPPGQPLAVCAAPMYGDKGLLDLVDSWQYVLQSRPAAKLWIIGHGPASKHVWNRIVSKQLTDSIVMPGQFDDLSDVFRAADAYVHPLRENTGCSMLSRAMLAGLCPIICQPVADKLDLTENQNAVFAPAANPIQLSKAILRPVEYPEQYVNIGLAATEWAAERYHVQNAVDTYLSVFDRNHSNPANSTSSEV